MPDVYLTGAAASSNGLLTVEILGGRTLVQTLRALAPRVEREVRQAIHEAGRGVLQDARSYAVMGKAPSGDYSGSLSMRDLARGVKIQSTDPGAGAIEFANAGAVYLKGRFRGRPIGTPAVAKPKALIQAKEDHEADVISTVQQALAYACDQVRGV